ncbi:zinc chelation protein SecC [Methylomonas sp. LL1]|uniref:YchJ family protein n=1 Tax=Methylomonas sp. LL1 TaxID=2785785 RepID=UPI0018C3E417|nr:YchJ family metal-binding protein [Methylomonas sp. LL1]QPK64671.1 zinc chelation protein SecC [Methylomonas sp. LL1]
MTTTTDEIQACLCGSGLAYPDCCGLYHSGKRLPDTAEALMRSRFTAYARRDAAYLLASWNAGKRPASLDFSEETALWHSLQIINCKKGGVTNSKGIVEFKAFYNQDGIEYFMHEISRFVKTGQRWFYLDGVIKAAGKTEAGSNTDGNALCTHGGCKKFKSV